MHMYGNLKVFTGSYDEYSIWKESYEQKKTEVSDVPKTVAVVNSNRKNQQRQRKIIEGRLRNKYYKESTPIKNRIEEIEMELSELEIQFKESESLFSNAEHYENSAQVVANIERHRQLKENINSLTEEWEKLSIELDEIKSAFEDAKNNIDI